MFLSIVMPCSLMEIKIFKIEGPYDLNCNETRYRKIYCVESRQCCDGYPVIIFSKIKKLFKRNEKIFKMWPFLSKPLFIKWFLFGNIIYGLWKLIIIVLCTPLNNPNKIIQT
jgi:hypothetical protein